MEARQVLSGGPIISEFLASNQDGLVDQSGDAGDWIEIYNPTTSAIDLAGWSLTDSAGDLNKWQFPQVSIAAHQFLVVFADSKNIASGAELHTNFSLSADGEYLALVDPNGVVQSEYVPGFPAQVSDVSYGVEFDTTNFLGVGSAAQAIVPANDNLGTTWTAPSFVPQSWTSGTSGVGFGIVQPGFDVTYVKSTQALASLSAAEQVVATPSLQAGVVHTNANSINYMANGGGGHYGSDAAFPTQTIGADIDWFLIQATGKVTIPTTGTWSFGVNSDDGFSLRLERNGVVFTTSFTGTRAASDTIGNFNIPEAGDWNLSLLMFENAGGASVELFAAPGSLSSFTADFKLIGGAGGLAVNTIPGGDSEVAVGTNVSAMLNQNASAYVRLPFTVADPLAFDELHLDMRYDDGFVAYLNGSEVARRNAPTSTTWNSAATADRAIGDVVTPERIDLTSSLGLLLTGNNVLAIHALNSSAADGSLLVLPKLTASAVHADQLRYSQTPTPGDPNAAPSLGIVERVVANVNAGFYTSAQTVTLSTPTDGATIRYTTNGSTPSATNGTVYSGPIPISATTVLRAQAFKTSYVSLPSITRTYLFLDDVIVQSPSDDITGGYPATGVAPAGWPTSWGSNTVDYGMDQTVVNQEGSAQVKSALLAIPTISITTDLANLFDPTIGIYANPSQDGSDWERPASVELLNPDGSTGFQVNAGLRLRGGYSRSTLNPKHAFRLFFRGEYGDSSLEYPMFGTEGADSFKKLDLRTAQNYSWSFAGDSSNTMIQDGFERASQGAMGQAYTRSRWYHLYLDGQYWGVYQSEERPEADYGATYFGGADDDYDVVKVEAGPYTIYATNGDLDAYQRLFTAVTTQDLSSNVNYYRLQGKNASGVDDPSIPSSDVLLDVDNLLVYMIGIYHSGNTDAPISNFIGNVGVNNFFAVRNRNGREGFRYVQHDAEHTLVMANLNVSRLGPYGSTTDFSRFNPQLLHQQLMANADYRTRFADLVQKFFFNDGPMTVANQQARYQQDVTALNQAIIAESVRWGDSKVSVPLKRSNWLTAVAAQRDNFIVNRNAIFMQQIKSFGWFPGTNAPATLINGAAQSSGQVTPGSQLRFTAPSGLVYYTTNGSDPRLLGGGINPAALTYNPGNTSTTIIAAGSSWKYFDLGSNLGTSWRNTSFNDAAWSAGNAQFGYGDGDETQVVSYGPNAASKYVTTYFRKTFNVATPSSYTGFKLFLKRDDGAVVYVNGTEVARSNVSAGQSSTTLASATFEGVDETTYYEFDISPSQLVAGQNVIAVEVHQAAANSPDLSFDAQLIGTSAGTTSPAIVVTGSTQVAARTFNGVNWSPLLEAAFSAPSIAAAAGNLAVTEIHYNPIAQSGASVAPFNDKENYEFIELRNIGSQTINLAGARFTLGITFDFTTADVTFLEPGQSVVVVANVQAFQLRYGTGVLVAGVYSGNLSNGGETITLVNATNAVIQTFAFDDEQSTTPKWPASADGGGPSLTAVSVTGNYSDPANWRASYVTNGTPGAFEANLLVPVITAVTPFVGPTSGGNVVVITGANFAAIEPGHLAGAVKFGSANAVSYTLNSATQITAVAPARSASTVDVTVTHAGGTSATSTTADDYTYAVPAATSVVVGGIATSTLTGATWASGNPLVTVASTAGLVAGAQVSSLGAGFPARATVLSVDSGTTFTLDSAPTAAQSTATTIRAANAPKKSGTALQLTGATWTNGSAIVTVASTTNLIAGQYLGSATPGLPADVVVASVTDDTTFVLSSPATLSATDATIDVAYAAVARDRFGNLVDLSGPTAGSVVQHLVMTFNQKVTLDPNAFAIVNLGSSVATNSVAPATGDVAVVTAGVPGTGDDATGYTQYVLNFAPGSATNALTNSGLLGNAFTTLKNGLYRLDVIGAKVHSGSETGTSRSDTFWSLYGVANAGDVVLTGSLGGGDDELRIDGIALSDAYATFGSAADVANPPYSPSFDGDLDGDVDGIDLSRLYSSFGTIWNF